MIKWLLITFVLNCIPYFILLYSGIQNTLCRAIVSYGFSCVTCIVLNVVLGIPFRYGLLIALIAWFIMNCYLQKKKKEIAAKYVQETLDFLDDLSHFMPGRKRYASVYYSNTEHAVIVDVIIPDGEIEKDIYDSVYDRLGGEHVRELRDEHYFGSYRPKTCLCYEIFASGTADDDMLSKRFSVSYVSGYTPELNYWILEEARIKYPITRTNNDSSFSVCFS